LREGEDHPTVVLKPGMSLLVSRNTPQEYLHPFIHEEEAHKGVDTKCVGHPEVWGVCWVGPYMPKYVNMFL